MRKLMFIISVFLFGLSSCKKSNDDSQNANCNPIWTVSAETTTPYKITRNNSSVDFEVENLTDNKFLIFQRSSNGSLAGIVPISIDIKLREIIAESKTSAVGDRVSIFLGYEENGKIVAHTGVAITRGDFKFLHPDGGERSSFFSPMGDRLNYEIRFRKNAYGVIQIYVKNLETNAPEISEAFDNSTNGKINIFGIMASSTLSSRFGTIDRLRFSFDEFRFLDPNIGFKNDMFQCGFIQ